MFGRIMEMGYVNRGLPLSRYLHWDAFKQLLERRTLRLRNCQAYEDFDFMEGKVSEPYRIVIRNAVELEHQEDSPLTVDEEFDRILTNFEIFRQHTYISCWTTNEKENENMWHSYANPGVIVRTTLGQILEQFYEFTDSEGTIQDYFDHYDLQDEAIDYNREQMHLKLDLNNYTFHKHPIFHLSGDEVESYRHEQEYRFAIVDNATAFDIQDDYSFHAGPGPFEFERKVREIEIPFNPAVIQEIVFCKAIASAGTALLNKSGYEPDWSISSCWK